MLNWYSWKLVLRTLWCTLFGPSVFTHVAVATPRFNGRLSSLLTLKNASTISSCSPWERCRRRWSRVSIGPPVIILGLVSMPRRILIRCATLSLHIKTLRPSFAAVTSCMCLMSRRPFLCCRSVLTSGHSSCAASLRIPVILISRSSCTYRRFWSCGPPGDLQNLPSGRGHTNGAVCVCAALAHARLC